MNRRELLVVAASIGTFGNVMGHEAAANVSHETASPTEKKIRPVGPHERTPEWDAWAAK